MTNKLTNPKTGLNMMDEHSSTIVAVPESTDRRFAPLEDAIPQLLRYRRIAIAVGDGATLFAAKTAINLLRYRREDVIAVIDSANRGLRAGDVYHAGDQIPIVGTYQEAPAPDAIFIGIAPTGGKLTEALRSIIAAAIDAGTDVVSGLHDFVSEDPEFARAAAMSGSKLIDVRKNRFKFTATAEGFRPGCLRIHTVGHDCSVGKMVTALELERALRRRHFDAKFLATGQTGIMIVGSGVPIDCVVSDFVNGSIEELVIQHQQHNILLIEGQGCITHPAFSGVTLGLLHGCAPHGLIMCYEVGRTQVKGLPHRAIPKLERLRTIYEQLGSERHPCQVIGVAMNSRSVTVQEAAREIVSARLGLPVCDVYRDGPDRLVDAVLSLKRRLDC